MRPTASINGLVGASVLALASASLAGLPATPTPQWEAPQPVLSPPVLVQLTDDNGDGLVTGEDFPDVAFVNGQLGGPLLLIVLDGPTGTEILREPLAATDSAGAGLAAGDLDGDGSVEFAITNARAGAAAWLEVLHQDGSSAWSTSIGGNDDFCFPGLADLDQDGVAELYVSCQDYAALEPGRLSVFAPDGTELWQDVFRSGGSFQAFANAVDLVPAEPGLELLVGGSCWAADGRLLWRNPDVTDGAAGIGDLDGDGRPEIVVADSLHIWVLDAAGSLLSTRDETSWIPSPPVIADIDGDGAGEVVVPLNTRLTAFDWDGSALVPKWEVAVLDATCCANASAYDFDCDGMAEILYSDESSWYVFDGLDGSELHRGDNQSLTGFEMPIPANLDGDSSAEIIVAALQGSLSGMAIYEVVGAQTPRRVWNQQTYHVTNVDDDNGIPRFEPNPWDQGYGWLEQAGTGCCFVQVDEPLADVVACAGDAVILDATGLNLPSCPGALDYEWRDASDTLIGTEPTLEVTADVTMEYEVTVTCSEDPDCSVIDAASVIATRRPTLGDVSVIDLSECSLGLELSWTPADFDSGLGTYNIYRSIGPGADCSDALASPPIQIGWPGLRYIDRDTTPDEPHVYVVEAEDAATPSGCSPTGPRGGAAVRSCAPPIVDLGTFAFPDGVGNVLRLTHAGHDVTLAWVAARALLPEEHFHVLEASDAQEAFVRANSEADLSRSWRHQDEAAALRFFDLRVANGCEEQSLDEFPPSR